MENRKKFDIRKRLDSLIARTYNELIIKLRDQKGIIKYGG